MVTSRNRRFRPLRRRASPTASTSRDQAARTSDGLSAMGAEGRSNFIGFIAGKHLGARRAASPVDQFEGLAPQIVFTPQADWAGGDFSGGILIMTMFSMETLPI